MKKERKIPEKVDVWAFFNEYFTKKAHERLIDENNKMSYILNHVDFFNNDLRKIKFVRRS